MGESLEGQEAVKLGHEIKAYANNAWSLAKERLWKIPVLGKACQRVAKIVPDDHIKATIQRVTNTVARTVTPTSNLDTTRRPNNQLTKITLDKTNFSNSFRASSRVLRGSVDEGISHLRRASLEHVPENDRRLSLGATADTNVGLRQ